MIICPYEEGVFFETLYELTFCNKCFKSFNHCRLIRDLTGYKPKKIKKRGLKK